jgi:hypothetical protein
MELNLHSSIYLHFVVRDNFTILLPEANDQLHANAVSLPHRRLDGISDMFQNYNTKKRVGYDWMVSCNNESTSHYIIALYKENQFN